ncbi:transcriptional regulator [Lactobacillus amylolyticus]|nr:transcriptional regulator [Lactobacillus amylolyticus]
MANYYEAMFNNDQLKINSILTFMEKNNLKKLAKRITID